MKNTNVFRRLKIVNFSMHFIWSVTTLSSLSLLYLQAKNYSRLLFFSTTNSNIGVKMRCRDSEAEKHFLFSNFVVALPHFLYVFSEMVWVSALMTAASAAASASTSVKTSKIYTSNISLKRERNRSTTK